MPILLTVLWSLWLLGVPQIHGISASGPLHLKSLLLGMFFPVIFMWLVLCCHWLLHSVIISSEGLFSLLSWKLSPDSITVLLQHWPLSAKTIYLHIYSFHLQCLQLESDHMKIGILSSLCYVPSTSAWSRCSINSFRINFFVSQSLSRVCIGLIWEHKVFEMLPQS